MKFLQISVLACCLGVAGGHESPHAKVARLPLQDVQWTGGFWKDRVTTCYDGMIPSMWEIMKGTEYKPFLQHFRIAAGLAGGRYRGAKWNDGDFYKWMEGVCAMLAVRPDAEWEARLDEIIDVIGQAQREDGYIHTPILIAARNGDPEAKPFSDRFAFEMYNMGHLITAACVHHEVTGKDNFLKIAYRTAAFLEEAFSKPSEEQARHAICPSHYMGILDLYRLTGEKRYLDLSAKLIGMRDLVAEGGAGGDDNQDRLRFADQKEVMGHAVRANYLYAGIADLYAETGDASLKRTLETLWQNLVEKKMYITGACGALYDGASPDASSDQGNITRIHQAYGRNYQLPNTTAHNETCANIGNLLWNWRMFLLSGESKYMDVLELTLYNSVLSGVSLEGKDYFYTNPLRVTDPLPIPLRWSRERVPFVTSYCCPPNVVRTVAQVNGYAFAKSEQALWINLYGTNRVATTIGGEQWVLSQTTAYPWDGKIRLAMDTCGTEELALRLRIPGWASGAALWLNGEKMSVASDPGTYAIIEREWKAGDVVELQVPMEAQLIESHPLVEETRNEVAVKRGPVVYCLESHDLPEGVRLADVRVPSDIALAARHDQDLLDGVHVVSGELTVHEDAQWDGGGLYRPHKRAKAKAVEANFVPYYAWANRGPGEMSVWLPLEIR